MNATQYLQKKLLDHTLNIASFTMPTVHLGLFTASPGESGSLANEVTGGSYARVELTSKMAATVLGTGIAENSSAVTFATPSASWGMITYAGVLDTSTLASGNVLFWLPLLYPSIPSVAPSFPIGSLKITAFTEGILSQLTQYLAKKWLDHSLGKSAFTAPSATYLGLFSSDPGATGSLAGEIATGGYARQNLFGSMGATDLATGISSNGDPIIFPTPTANYNVTHFGWLDALSSGNMMMRKARTTTLVVTTSSAAVRLDIGGLQLRAQ